MRLTSWLRLSLSDVLLASGKGKKKKTDNLLVECRSVITNYQLRRVKPRLSDKLEFMAWDPMVQKKVLFREVKKVISVRERGYNEPPLKYDELKTDAPVAKEDIWYRLPDKHLHELQLRSGDWVGPPDHWRVTPEGADCDGREKFK